jgi:hypothetical protein
MVGKSSRVQHLKVHAVQYGEHTEAARRAQKQHTEALAAAEQRRKLRTMVVPTDGAEVKVWLRKLKEPITLFGEGPMERRERLRVLMTTLSDESRNALLERVMQLEVQNRKAPAEKFYTEGPPELREHRRCAPFAKKEKRSPAWSADWGKMSKSLRCPTYPMQACAGVSFGVPSQLPRHAGKPQPRQLPCRQVNPTPTLLLLHAGGWRSRPSSARWTASLRSSCW